ncbi:hypothetical protein CHS0354_012669 [Potamilus streckersoni]|uniref:Ig-like domain-containing protein n=1 Tax=Potamilus streckersoni TaxID=2493646 RepID=A0AAE0SYL4_9BIVA|nr:hypothetical protein CHS0354_012669 [Potamilus streckersoni]
MIFTSSLLLFFTCTWMLSECIVEEDIYALVGKEAKLYFDYNLDWNNINIQNDGGVLASIQKKPTDMKISFSGKNGIDAKSLPETNKILVTIKNVNSSYNGNITMLETTTGLPLKLWRVHVLEGLPANPVIKGSSPTWAGQDYELNCISDSFGVVSKYLWYKGGQLLTSSTKYNVTGNKLTIGKIRPEDSTNLTCVLGITDDIRSNNSAVFFVNVWHGPDNITITSEPPGFTVEDGKPITLFCSATCNPPCNFQWSGLVTAMEASIKVDYNASNQNGPYNCTATNPKSAVTNKKSHIVFLNSEKYVTSAIIKTESTKDTSQEEGGVSGLSSGGRTKDSNLLALFYMVLMISIPCLKTVV